MNQYYDPTLDQAYHHNADNCGIHQNKSLNGIKTRPIHRRKFRQEHLPSGRCSDFYTQKKEVIVKLPWTGIKDYFKQCKKTKRNMKVTYRQSNTPS